MRHNLEKACIVLAMTTVVLDRPALEIGNTLHTSPNAHDIKYANWLARSLSLWSAELQSRTNRALPPYLPPIRWRRLVTSRL